jgi:predicted nuclease with TOPRIM domain
MSHPQVIDLQQNVDSLIQAYKELRAENQRLQDEVERARDEVRRVHVVENQLRKTNAALQVANGVNSTSEQERAKAKQRIDQMIVNIDKCLALLAMM